MTTDRTGMVKVGLRAPGGEFETMWATPVGVDRYRLENSPFYAYGVSWQDVVEALPEEADGSGFPVVRRPVEKSGHRTIRLILVPGTDESPEHARVLEDLIGLGCSYEGYNTRYFAIDIPPGVEMEAVTRYLVAGQHQWEYVDPTYEQVHPGAVEATVST